MGREGNPALSHHEMSLSGSGEPDLRGWELIGDIERWADMESAPTR